MWSPVCQLWDMYAFAAPAGITPGVLSYCFFCSFSLSLGLFFFFLFFCHFLVSSLLLLLSPFFFFFSFTFRSFLKDFLFFFFHVSVSFFFCHLLVSSFLLPILFLPPSYRSVYGDVQSNKRDARNDDDRTRAWETLVAGGIWMGGQGGGGGGV